MPTGVVPSRIAALALEEYLMPEAELSNNNVVTGEEGKKVASTHHTSYHRSHRGQSRSFSRESESTNAGAHSIRISALGSEKTIQVPSEAAASATGRMEEISEGVSLLKLADSHNVVCLTETKGHIREINEIVRKHNARAVIHTGDFGFYDANSYKNMSPKELRNMVQFGPLSNTLRHKLMRLHDGDLRKACEGVSFSELGLFLTGEERLEVPVYVIWGNQEDVQVLKKFADGSYHVPNLYILNQDSSFTISLGGSIIRLFGLGGAYLYHRFFDIGQGTPTVSGADGLMWATLIQIGSLIELSERYKDPNEIRVFVSHVCPGKEGLVNLIATALQADFTLSGSLHGKFCHCYTDFSIRTLSNFYEHISMARTEIPRIWAHVLQVLGEDQLRQTDRKAVERVLEAVRYEPKSDAELKAIWHLNLTDVKQGHLVLKMDGDQLQFEPIVNQGWHLSMARGEKDHHHGTKDQRRRSSIKEQRKEEVKQVSEPVVPAAATAAVRVVAAEPTTVSAVPQEQPSALTAVPPVFPLEEPKASIAVPTEEPKAPVTVPTEEPKTLVDAPFVLKISGFAPNQSQSDLERMYGFKYIRYSCVTYNPTDVLMGFQDARDLERVRKSVANMRHGDKNLTAEVITSEPGASTATSVVSPSTSGPVSPSTTSPISPSASVPTPHATSPVVPAPASPSQSHSPTTEVKPSEPSKPVEERAFGQRRTSPTDFAIEGLTW